MVPPVGAVPSSAFSIGVAIVVIGAYLITGLILEKVPKGMGTWTLRGASSIESLLVMPRPTGTGIVSAGPLAFASIRAPALPAVKKQV